MIRLYRPSDKEQLIALLRLNTPAYFAAEEEEDFKSYLDKEAEHYFVVEENCIIVGSGGINYLEEGTQARISWDIVHPAHQGKGIGRALTSFRLQEIQKNTAVQVIMVRTSQFVYKFYEKLGFELEKVEKDYWAKGYDLYQMRYPG
ncbi:GNAT family N-acetyltransferase [uncultured Pontibacter sp.]|uniref:GNAT family N-acetyltransferase n=1 Tax=uncultured Pontibacter sp. TaxID=453356 RepID=UPI0026262F87|nr:GNAT family N-acetyltransferase [uncultured Pontibacter sp.]